MLTHLAALLGDPLATESWRERVTAALPSMGIELVPSDGDGWWIEIGSVYGEAWLLDRDALALRHPGSPLLGYTSDCPFLADLELVGYVEWLEHDPNHRPAWLRALRELGMAAVARSSGGVVRSSVVERELELADNLGKFGFDDGDMLLTREVDQLRDYRRAMRAVIANALAQHGLDAQVDGPQVTCHNVFRLYPPLQLGDRSIALEHEIRRALGGVTARLWVYDDTLASDESLFPP